MIFVVDKLQDILCATFHIYGIFCRHILSALLCQVCVCLFVCFSFLFYLIGVYIFTQYDTRCKTLETQHLPCPEFSYLNSAGWNQMRHSSLCSCRAQNPPAPWWLSPTHCSPSAGRQQETWWAGQTTQFYHHPQTHHDNNAVKVLKSPWGGVLGVKSEVGERSTIFTPLQRVVTLLRALVPGEESKAFQCHRGSHVPPQSVQASIRFK